MHITRIYADANGESHFEDIQMELSAIGATTSSPRVSAAAAASHVVFVELPARWSEDWHPAPRRQYWIGLRGTLDVTVSDGETRQFGARSVALLEDVFGKGHVTRAAEDDVVGIFVRL